MIGFFRLSLTVGSFFLAAAKEPFTDEVGSFVRDVIAKRIHEPQAVKEPMSVAADEESDTKRVLQGAPTKYPTWSPTKNPTAAPTIAPTVKPVLPPSDVVTYSDHIVYTYHSCVADNPASRVFNFLGGTGMSTFECARTCQGYGFEFAARQYFGECWCGSDENYKYGTTTGCDCEGVNVGSDKMCTYRLYAPSNTVPPHISDLPGMSCAKPAFIGNGARVDFVHCPNGAGTEKWEMYGGKIKHSSGRCLHLRIQGTEINLATRNCLDTDNVQNSNQIWSYHGTCSGKDCDESMTGTGFQGSCYESSRVCEGGVIWNRHYAPNDLKVIFKDCEEVKEFDPTSKDGRYALQHPDFASGIFVHCYGMAGFPKKSEPIVSSQLSIKSVAFGPGVAGNAKLYIDGAPDQTKWTQTPFASLPLKNDNTYVTSDLGALHHITDVIIWMYWADSRYYYSQKLEISATGSFTGEQAVLYDTGLGMPGPIEIAQGNKYSIATPLEGRYIRWHSGYSNKNEGVHFIHMRAFGAVVNP